MTIFALHYTGNENLIKQEHIPSNLIRNKARLQREMLCVMCNIEFV